MLRGSGSDCGTLDPPPLEVWMEPVAKWSIVSSTTRSGVARTAVIAELRESSE